MEWRGLDVKGPAFRVSPAVSSSGALSLEDGGKLRAERGWDTAWGDMGRQPGRRGDVARGDLGRQSAMRATRGSKLVRDHLLLAQGQCIWAASKCSHFGRM